MLGNLPKRIELAFWNLVIPLMSNHPGFQYLIRRFYAYISDRETHGLIIFLGVACITGFLGGMLLFYLVHLF